MALTFGDLHNMSDDHMQVVAGMSTEGVSRNSCCVGDERDAAQVLTKVHALVNYARGGLWHVASASLICVTRSQFPIESLV